jgi:hypothetical protein
MSGCSMCGLLRTGSGCVLCREGERERADEAAKNKEGLLYTVCTLRYRYIVDLSRSVHTVYHTHHAYLKHAGMSCNTRPCATPRQ